MLAQTFNNFIIQQEVALWGDFEAKSQRRTPYFFNFAKLNSALAMQELSQFYASKLMGFLAKTDTKESATNIDIVFGPAYKGISLCMGLVLALANMDSSHSLVAYAYNRKEKKEHGDKGMLVGAQPQAGSRICIVDDVITSGGSLIQSIELLKEQEPKCTIACILVGIDREEYAPQNPLLSAAEYIEKQYAIPLIALTSIRRVLCEVALQNTVSKEILARSWEYLEAKSPQKNVF